MSDQRREELRAIAAEAARHLEWLKDAGVREVERGDLAGGARKAGDFAGGARKAPPVPPLAPVQPHPAGPALADLAGGAQKAPPVPPLAPVQPHPAGPALTSTTSYSLASKGCGSELLLAIRAELGECTRCKLAPTRTTLVFGVGAPRAELMFVGEGPGADEDAQGEPFVGKAGQLLTRMIEAMGYRREEVYIANVVKCRPPGNRNPEPDEIEACEPYLRRQIEAVGPRVIVALGKFAAQTLLRSAIPITKLRGTWSSYQGVKLMPTFHPAYLLRSPEEKKRAWADLQLVMAELGKAPPR